MNLRTILGAILTVYGVMGFSILFVPVVSTFYQNAVSGLSANPSLAKFLSFLNLLPSPIENFVWFSLCLFAGVFLLAYRKLKTKQKPPWLRGIVSQQKSLG